MVMLADIERAAAAIKGQVVSTPCLPSLTLSRQFGCEIFIKFENQQFTSSFKERGALHRLQLLSEEERARGVVCMSAGNHAQAVAYHAARLGIEATIVMPKATPNEKILRTEDHGAHVVVTGDSLEESDAAAHKLEREKGLVFIHPYDDEAVIAGQGTIALEMMEQQPDLEVVVVPIGGGGLISGVATAAKALKPEIEVVGVEAARYPSFFQALGGEPVETGGATIAEGIAVKQPGKLTLPIVRDLVDGIVLAPEQALERAVSLFITVEKSVAEGAGAAGLAAILSEPERFRGRKVGIILCGGNIDSRVLASVLMRDLVHQGRIAQLRVQIVDTPGALADIAEVIGEEGGNIIEVNHRRLFSAAQVRETEIDVVMEARDPEHMQRIVHAIQRLGTTVRLLDQSESHD
ncbi:MAG: threonine ammonia-lyase [Alphaproteobacteria bacterium]|nr:threonine ammonia-lyase [Alphaproteobacteria bacterium]